MEVKEGNLQTKKQQASDPLPKNTKARCSRSYRQLPGFAMNSPDSFRKISKSS